MSFNWNEYGEFAKKSLDLSEISEETKLRNYCSRVYYNCMHCLANFAEYQFGFSLPRVNAHISLIKELRNRGRKVHADLLWEIKDIREKCDYDESYPGCAADFEKLKDYAEEILRFVNDFGQKKQKKAKK